MDYKYFKFRIIDRAVGHHKRVIDLMGKEWKKTSWFQYKLHTILNQKHAKLYTKLLELKFWIQYFIFRKISLGFMDHQITTQCTLQCEQCCSLMTFYTKSTHHIEGFEQFKANLDSLLRQIRYIYISTYRRRTTA